MTMGCMRCWRHDTLSNVGKLGRILHAVGCMQHCKRHFAPPCVHLTLCMNFAFKHAVSNERSHPCRLVAYFHAFGFLALALREVLPSLVAISAICTLVETIPVEQIDDNISVPLAAAAASQALGFTVRLVL